METQLPSSPPLVLSTRESTPDSDSIQLSKPRKKSTVTPRSFRRFFTPRTSLERGRKLGASRHALTDITLTGANRHSRVRKRCSPESDYIHNFDSGEKRCIGSNSPQGSQRFEYTPDTTPERSSPLKRLRGGEACELPALHRVSYSSVGNLIEDLKCKRPRTIRPVVMSGTRGMLGAMLRRESCISMAPSARLVTAYSPDWRSETANFYSAPEDMHLCTNVVAEYPERSLPFCSTACNTNSLIAVGDEEGGVRLLESERDGKPTLKKPYLTFRPHHNAILDLAFSADDLFMATASGDQTAQIIDMPTQRASHTLSGHASSVKQVRFQPGSNSKVIATSSRDGSIQIWDLRCKGTERPVADIKVNLGGTVSSSVTTAPSSSKVTYATCVNMIQGAHASTASVFESSDVVSGYSGLARSQSRKSLFTHQRSEVSITSISFLSDSKPHLILSGSEASATVRLWDLRTNHSNRLRKAVPVSVTRQPDSHGTHRQFGLTSMVLSGDGARLFTLCKDSTIYAYSTAHLILGTAPELEPHRAANRIRGIAEKEGLGPIYGFRHRKLKVSTFYVKLALRPAQFDKGEMLAVGSTDSCAVLIPTHKQHLRHFRTRTRSPSDCIHDANFSAEQSHLSQPNSIEASSTRLHDTIPIYNHGLALIRGHDREVTSVAWSCDGELITVGDDMKCRVWRENGQKARGLRTVGEANGDRWCHGWAELGTTSDEWDQDE